MKKFAVEGKQIVRSRECFVCGTENPSGLGLTLYRDEEQGHVTADFTPGKAQLGFSKAVHGGIVAALLDEVVGVACGLRTDGKCATVELTISYRRPVLADSPIRIEGWYVRQQKRFCWGAGQIVNQAGEVLATARGKFITLSEKHIARFVG